MKYGIVGSRSRIDKESVADFILGNLSSADTIISGGCKGVDTWAIETANILDIPAEVFLPQLNGCSTRWQATEAYYARNRQIAEACDILVAFVSASRTGGTEHTIKQARALNRPVIILAPPGEATQQEAPSPRQTAPSNA